MNEHKSRFKAYLIPHSELQSEAQKIRSALEVLQKYQDKMSDAERVFYFILIYLEARNPGAWWMSRGGKETSFLKNKNFLFSSLFGEFDFLKNIEAQDIQEFYLKYDFKKLPGAILNCLISWHQNKYHLILKDQPVTPLEMLSIQARGERVVTLDVKTALSGGLVDGTRDALEFLLHDLVHADLFFSQNHLEQKQFFKNMENFLNNSSPSAQFFSQALARDAEFTKDINYLISDMNSHLAHMQAQLKASLVKHQLWCEKKSPQESLSLEGRERLEAQWVLMNTLIFP